MKKNKIVLITGTRKGIGLYLARYYIGMGMKVIGCSRGKSSIRSPSYDHFCLDVADEASTAKMFGEIRRVYKRLDVLINNAGIASMNHALLTPYKTVQKILATNVAASFLFIREAAKLMRKKKYGRIVNLTSVAVPLELEGESIYAASKSAVMVLTKILARELAGFGITVNALGPAPTKTDLIDSISQDKIAKLMERQSIKRMTRLRDISNVVDFFIHPRSDFVTGQVLYLGGV